MTILFYFIKKKNLMFNRLYFKGIKIIQLMYSHNKNNNNIIQLEYVCKNFKVKNKKIKI